MTVSAPVLAQRIVGFLQEHKYEVATSYDEKHKTWALIQARDSQNSYWKQMSSKHFNADKKA